MEEFRIKQTYHWESSRKISEAAAHKPLTKQIKSMTKKPQRHKSSNLKISNASSSVKVAHSSNGVSRYSKYRFPQRGVKKSTPNKRAIIKDLGFSPITHISTPKPVNSLKKSPHLSPKTPSYTIKEYRIRTEDKSRAFIKTFNPFFKNRPGLIENKRNIFKTVSTDKIGLPNDLN